MIRTNLLRKSYDKEDKGMTGTKDDTLKMYPFLEIFTITKKLC